MENSGYGGKCESQPSLRCTAFLLAEISPEQGCETILVLVIKDLTCRLNILCSNPFLGGSGG